MCPTHSSVRIRAPSWVSCGADVRPDVDLPGRFVEKVPAVLVCPETAGAGY